MEKAPSVLPRDRQRLALGVDDSTAFAIAFTHRLCRYYLPPVWGYFSMQWLRGKAYI